jgi:hypothetical protein
LEISEKRAQQSVEMISKLVDYTDFREIFIKSSLKKKLDKKTRSPLSLKSVDEVHPARNGRHFIRPFLWGTEHKSIFPQP